MSAEKDFLTIAVPKGKSLPSFWQESESRNYFWLTLVPKIHEMFHTMGQNHEHNITADVVREQVLILCKQQHADELERLRSMLTLTHENQEKQAQMAHSQMEQIYDAKQNEFTTQISTLNSQNASLNSIISSKEQEIANLSAELKDLKAKIPKKYMTVGKYGSIAEQEVVDCISKCVPCFVKDVSNRSQQTATTHGDRHIFTQSDPK